MRDRIDLILDPITFREQDSQIPLHHTDGDRADVDAPGGDNQDTRSGSLLQDVFRVGLAITIMPGLTFDPILTMVPVPMLFAPLFRLNQPDDSGQQQVHEPRGQPVSVFSIKVS